MPQKKNLFWFAIPAIAAVVMVWGWPLAPDYDLLFHLKVGELIWQKLQIVTQDVFTYTQHGMPDESWNSWLAKLTFYAIHSAAGDAGLRALNAMIVLGILGVIYQHVLTQTRHWGYAALVTCLALCLHNRIQTLRPLLFAELIFVFLTVCWFAPFQNLTRNKARMLFLLTILWANLHASVVVLLPVAILYALAKLYESGKGKIPWLSVSAPFLVLAASTVNPVGLNIYRYAFRLSSLGSSLAGEWRSHFPLGLTEKATGTFLHVATDINSLIIFASALALFGLFTNRHELTRGTKLFWGLTTLFCCALAVSSTRHIGYLLFPLAILSPLVFWRLANWQSRPMRWPAFWLVFCLGVLAHFRFYQSYFVLPSPERAVQFLKDTNLKGNIFNFHGWGSYLLYHRYPDNLIALDNRTMLHKEFFSSLLKMMDEHGDNARALILASPPKDTQIYFVSAPKLPLNLYLDPTRWIVVYENNETAIAIERTANDKLERVLRYYKQRGVPFDLEGGFSLHQVARQAPQWLASQLEIPSWGQWTAPAIKTLWIKNQFDFLVARGLNFKVPNEESALEEIPPESIQWINADAGLPAIEIKLSALSFLLCALGMLGLGYLLFLAQKLRTLSHAHP